MGPANPAGFEHVGGICKTFTQQGGKIIQEIWPPLGTQDFKPFLAQIKSEADVVMAFFAGGDALRFVQQYEEVGLKGKIALIAKGDLVSEHLLTQQGKAADGIASVLHWCFLLDTPENVQFKVSLHQEVWAAAQPVCRTGVRYRNGNCGGAEKDQRTSQRQGIRECHAIPGIEGPSGAPKIRRIRLADPETTTSAKFK